MRIRKLELHGFKSFPDRTVLHFDPGISCIVGPNGCGKSNIVDALRWCIGEQSARSLRGGEMLDVIFAGSQERKPVGFAEVVMTMTTDGAEPFPGEFAQLTEVSVGRRLHRSGQSEYLINQRRVRRRDVVDLFLDTGVGNNLYSFIEQGRIGKIVHARPEERRSLVDEAAGISRYKARRDEAQQRLTATAAQLDRAADVAEEMGRRVRILARQVRKAARFRHLRARIRQEEVVLALARYSALSQDRRALRAQLRTAEGELGTAQRGRLRREADLAERREELTVVEGGVDTWRDEVAELDARSRELAGAVGFAERRIEELTTRQQADGQALAETLAELEAAGAEASRLTEQGEQARERAAAQQDALTQAAEAQRLAAEAVAAARVTLDDLQGSLTRLDLDDERLQSEITAGQAQADDLPDRTRQALQAQEQAADARVAAREALEAAEDRRDRASVDAVGATARRDQAASDDAQAAQQLKEAEDALLRAEQARAQALGQARQALDALERVVARAEREVESSRSQGEKAVAEARRRAEDMTRRERSQARTQGQQKLAAARDRARAWLDALEADGRQAEQRWRRAADARDAAARRALQEALDEHESEAEQALEQALAQAQAQVQARRRALLEAQEAASDGLAAAERVLEQGMLDERAAQAAVAGAEARLAALDAALDEGRADSRGAEQARAALSDGRALAERLDDASRTDAVLLRRLGDRLTVPVTSHIEEVLQLAAALGDQATAQVLIRPEGVLDAASALGGVSIVPDLATALERYLAHGGAVVADDGSRITADGLVRVGPPDAAGARLARAVADREQALLDLERARSGLERSRAALQQAEADRDDADVAHAEAREALLQLGAQLEDTVSQIRARHRRTEDETRRQLREQADADEARRRQTLQTALRAHEQTSSTSLQDARAMRDQAVSLVQEEVTAAEGALEERLAQASEQVLQQASQQAQEASQRAQEALESARLAVRAHREGEEAVRVRHDEPVQVAREGVIRARELREAARTELATLAERLAAAELFLSKSDAVVEAARGTVERTATEVDAAAARTAAIQEQGSALLERLTQARAEREQVQERRVRGGEQLLVARASLTTAEATRDEAASGRARLEVEAATWSERARAAEQALLTLDERREAAQERQERLQQLLAEAADSLVQTTTTLQANTQEREQVDAARAQAWERLERERARLKDLKDGVKEAEVDLHRLTELELSLTRKVDGIRSSVESTRDDIETLRSRMDERYQLSVPGLLDQLDARGSLVLEVDEAVSVDVEVDGVVIPAVPPVAITSGDLTDGEAIAERVEALGTHRADLERIGEVNLAALDEWNEVRDRHQDLESQRADLEASVSRIRSAIAKMNRTCRQRFRDTFDLVNQHFQEMYPRLVGGGAARLSLTDEEDLLETGVDIFVQPPGKRLQNLSLLSGGEKAMTAIALILSLFKVKPSPFCVLDEVDAPLDEANGSRFNEALREMAQHSQFIVVTHNRKTMECAATLYGITMPQPGCSTLVSVQLGGGPAGVGAATDSR